MYIIEYSVKEQAFHIEPMSERMHKNIELAKRKVSKDYQAVGFAPTKIQADQQKKELLLLIKMEIDIYAN